MTVAEDIRRQCREKGSDAALAFGKPGPDTLSYGQLGHYVDAITARLHRQGIRPGTFCGIAIDAPIVHVVVLLALERLGAATASVRQASEFQSVKPAILFTDGVAPGPGCPVQRVDQSWFADRIEFPIPPLHVPSPNDICRVAFSSGSTGKPKAIAFTQGMLAERTLNQNRAFGDAFLHATRRLCLVGINTMFGYRIMLRTLSEGGLYCFTDQNIRRSVNRMAMYKVQAVLGSPLQLSDFASFGEAHPQSFSALELVISVGARLSPALADQLRERVCPNVMLSYASAELGVATVAFADKVDLAGGEVGRIVPGVELEVVDENDHPVTGVLGRVRVSTEGGPRAYHGQRAGESSSFNGKWFYPGDLGILSADGRLSIAGRADNVVNLSGFKTTLEAIEDDLVNGPGVKEIAVISRSDEMGVIRLIAFVVPKKDWSEPRFWDFCRKITDDALKPSKVVLLDALPLGATGKVDRRRLSSIEAGGVPTDERAGTLSVGQVWRNGTP